MQPQSAKADHREKLRDFPQKRENKTGGFQKKLCVLLVIYFDGFCFRFVDDYKFRVHRIIKLYYSVISNAVRNLTGPYSVFSVVNIKITGVKK
jgi:hypothetical protein